MAKEQDVRTSRVSSELLATTRAISPSWCVDAWHVPGATVTVVVDDRGRYWRARFGSITAELVGIHKNAPAIAILVPEFGPCETMVEALTTGL